MRLRIGIGMARMSALCHRTALLASYIIYGSALVHPPAYHGQPCEARNMTPKPSLSFAKIRADLETSKLTLSPRGSGITLGHAPIVQAWLWNARSPLSCAAKSSPRKPGLASTTFRAETAPSTANSWHLRQALLGCCPASLVRLEGMLGHRYVGRSEERRVGKECRS